MKTYAHLIINRRGVVSCRKTKPSLRSDEVSMRINIDLPDILFQKPQLEAKILVDEKAVIPANLTPQILIDSKELIQQVIGCNIDLRVVEQEKNTKGN
jgi:hypothetical protein